MIRYRKRKGYVLFIVLILMLLISSIMLSLTTRSISHSNIRISDQKRDKSYYLALAGAEMVYSALNEKKTVSGSTTSFETSLLEKTGSIDKLQIHSSSAKKIDGISIRENIMTKTNLEIKSDGVIVGYADIDVDLCGREGKPDVFGSYYYKITSTGKLSNNAEELKKTTNSHVITMFVYKDNANAPLIYDGYRQLP